MKIALITPNFIPLRGGTEVAVYNIAKRLNSRGHEVSIITRRLNDEDIRSCENITVHAFRSYHNSLSIIYTNLFLKKYLETYAGDVEILHQFHLLRFGLPVSIFSRIHRKPLITTLMGTDSYNPIRKYRKVLSPYLSYLMNKAWIVTSPSQDLIRHARHQGYKNKIEMIPHGVGDNYFSDDQSGTMRLKSSLTQNQLGRRVILSVQRLDRVKGVEIVIRAISLLVNKYKIHDILLIIVGDGPERNRLVKLTDDLKISGFIKFSGRIPQADLPNYYRCCDILALHSNYEAFGIVIAEAMACGKPVVSTFAGAIPEIVDHGKTGILVPPNNPEALAKALKLCLENEQLAKEMGAQGRIKATLLYRWDDICDRYVELYKHLTARPLKNVQSGGVFP